MKIPLRKNFLTRLSLISAILITLFFLFMFSYPLYINAVALINGFSASQEWGGKPGTVTMQEKATISSTGGSKTICLGEFTSADGQTIKKVTIHTPVSCEIGKTLPARFVKGQNTFLTGFEQDTAWVKGANDWIPNLLLVILFGVLTVVFALPILLTTTMILFRIVIRSK